MGRSFLITTAATVAAFGVGVTAGCKIPDTLGLPCEVDEHCDAPQQCRGGVCAVPGDGTEGTTDVPISTGEATALTEGATSSTTDADSSGAGTTMVLADSSSGEPPCGVGACSDVDILVVLDNSPSMTQWLLPLAASLNNLTNQTLQQFGPICSFHIGITVGDAMPADSPPECQFPGGLLGFPESCGVEAGHPRYLGSETETLAQALDISKCTLLQLGPNGSPDEVMLDSLVGAFDPVHAEAGACNEGFRRDNAHLLVLYISDEDDPTATEDLPALADRFEMYVDGWRTALIAVVADNPDDCPWNPDGTDSDGSGAQVASKLAGFLALTTIPLTQQAFVDICEMISYSFDDAFGVVGGACGA